MKWKLSLLVAALIAAAVGWSMWTEVGGPTAGSGLVKEATARQIMEHIRGLQSPVVVVNFWASWCEPCKNEFPSLLKLRGKYADRKLRLVLISIDGLDELSKAEEFLAQQKVDFPTFYKGDQSLRFVAEIFPQWTGSVPATVIMDSDLKILDGWEGENTQADFEKHITPHLRGT